MSGSSQQYIECYDGFRVELDARVLGSAHSEESSGSWFVEHSNVLCWGRDNKLKKGRGFYFNGVQ